VRQLIGFGRDGSVFPTSLGVNPMESIYGVASWGAGQLVASLR
jgi:choline dehydrogenase-like flavoprotein